MDGDAADGPDDVQVRLGVTGAGRPFSWVAPDTVSVPAGSQATVRVGFHMPKASVPPAGAIAFELTVDGSTAAQGTVEGLGWMKRV